MKVAALGTVRLTSEPIAQEQSSADIAQLFDPPAAGGVGIVPLGTLSQRASGLL